MLSVWLTGLRPAPGARSNSHGSFSEPADRYAKDKEFNQLCQQLSGPRLVLAGPNGELRMGLLGYPRKIGDAESCLNGSESGIAEIQRTFSTALSKRPILFPETCLSECLLLAAWRLSRHQSRRFLKGSS